MEAFFWVWNFRFRDIFGKENLASIFWGGLNLVGIFLDIQNNLKIHGSACVSQPRSSANKVQPNLFCVNKFNALDDYIVSVS